MDKKETYELQSKVQEILNRRTFVKEFRAVKCCHKSIIREVGKVSLYRSNTNGKSFFGGLHKCSSVWACPVCSQRIQARRSHEISKGMYWAYHNNHKAVMITLTHPHHAHQSLRNNMEHHNDAVKRFFSGKQFTLFKKRVGYVGMIKSNEITYGNNGWHYHTHLLFIVSKSCNIESEKEFLCNKWVNACENAGFCISDEVAFKSHGLDIMDNCHASDYLAKFGRNWGIDRELAKGASKKGHGKTPFELLANGEEDLFLEYVCATRGVRQLVWSKGLKALCGIVNKSDEEINEEDVDNASLICTLTYSQWQIVLLYGARAEILAIAENEGAEGVFLWLSDKEHRRYRFDE